MGQTRIATQKAVRKSEHMYKQLMNYSTLHFITLILKAFWGSY